MFWRRFNCLFVKMKLLWHNINRRNNWTTTVSCPEYRLSGTRPHSRAYLLRIISVSFGELIAFEIVIFTDEIINRDFKIGYKFIFILQVQTPPRISKCMICFRYFGTKSGWVVALRYFLIFQFYHDPVSSARFLSRYFEDIFYKFCDQNTLLSLTLPLSDTVLRTCQSRIRNTSKHFCISWISPV